MPRKKPEGNPPSMAEGKKAKAKRPARTARKPAGGRKANTEPKAAPVAFVSAEPADNRKANGQFGKGNRANPGGRPKENHEIRDLARTYTQEAIARLVFWMQSE